VNALQGGADAVHHALAAIALGYDMLLVIISRREKKPAKCVRRGLQVRAHKIHGREISESDENHRAGPAPGR
jgi:hypothetical protein